MINLNLELPEAALLTEFLDKQIIKLSADVRYLSGQGNRSLHKVRYEKELNLMRNVRAKLPQ